MGRADYYLSGSNNAICDQCGKKYKAKDLKKQWDGLFTCSRCYDYRNPQDYVRGVVDNMAPVLSRPEAEDEYTVGAQALPLPGSDTPTPPPTPPSNTKLFSFTSTGIPSVTSGFYIGVDTLNSYVIGLSPNIMQFAFVLEGAVLINQMFSIETPEGDFVIEHDDTTVYVNQDGNLIYSDVYTPFVPVEVVILSESPPNTITNIEIG